MQPSSPSAHPEADAPNARAEASGHRVGRLSTLSFLALGLERIFSLALIAVIAAVYGVSTDTDTYYLALIVPAALGFALTEAVYTAFIPYFGGPEGPTQRKLRAGLAVAGALTLLVAGGYVLVLLAAHPSHLSTWLAFTGLVAAQPIAGLYAAFFTAQRRYALSTLRVPFITAVGFAFALVLLAVWNSITAVAVAVSAGHVVQLFVLAALARRRVVPGDPEIVPRSVAILGPAASVFLASLVGGQLIVLIERFLASTLSTGAVTQLVNARGFVLVAAMAAQALAIGVFPAASERYRTLGPAALGGLALTALRLGVLVALVAAAYLMICRRELVQVALQRGKFSAEDSRETARLIAIMAPSLLGVSSAVVAGRTLFGMGRQRFVAVVSSVAVVVYAGAAAGLREVWGVEGLAAAFVIASLLTGATLCVALVLVLGLQARSAFRNWLLVPAALAAVFSAGAGAAWVVVGRGTGSVLEAIGTLAASAAAGLIALAIALVAVRAREWELLDARLRGRLVAR